MSPADVNGVEIRGASRFGFFSRPQTTLFAKKAVAWIWLWTTGNI
jgi:hypothetical protein